MVVFADDFIYQAPWGPAGSEERRARSDLEGEIDAVVGTDAGMVDRDKNFTFTVRKFSKKKKQLFI